MYYPPGVERKCSAGLLGRDDRGRNCRLLAAHGPTRVASEGFRHTELAAGRKAPPFYEDFSHRYARAREMQGHANAALAVESAVNANDAGLGRLAYDALKWHASKLVPKVYGDKTEIAHTGANGGPVQTVNATVEIPANDPIEAARVYQKLMSGD